MIRAGRTRNPRRLALAALALALPWAAGACDTISAALFGVAPTANPDATAPVFSNPRPAADVAVVSAEAFTIDITDPGGTPSGVNPASIQAQVIGLIPVPTTVILPTVTVHLSGVPDGPVQVAMVGADFAGNSAAYVFTTVLDRTAPTVGFPAPPDATITTSAPTRSIVFTVQAGVDPNFETLVLVILAPGPDGTCGTTDDVAVPASVVALPERSFSASGIYPVTYTLNNPVTPIFGPPQAELYCWVATARDTARTLDGEPGANTSRAVASTLVTWQAPPAQ
jgi:hypothetical protein